MSRTKHRHPSQHGWIAAVLALLSAVACQKPRDSSPPAAEPSPAPPPGATAPSAAAVPAEQPVKPAMLSASKLKNIAIDPQPLCARDMDRHAGDPKYNRWLADPAIQAAVTALDAELKPFAASLVGTAIDHGTHTAMVVFHTTFTDYEGVRARLLDKLGPLQVALRPACHTQAEITAAGAALERRDWHPRAKSVALSYGIDAAFSGYDVTIDESAPEVATALEQRLGPLVRVSLGKVERL